MTFQEINDVYTKTSKLLNMKFLFSLIIALLFSMTSCGQGNEGNSFSDATQTAQFASNQTHKRAIKYFPLRDTRNNMLIGLMPIPQDWHLSKKGDQTVFLESAKGVKVYYTNGNTFMYDNDPWMNQNYQQMGMQVQAPKRVEQLIEQDLKPYAKSQGTRFVRQYELPQLATYDQNFDRLFFKGVPEQKSFRSVLTEWVDDKGISSLLIIRYHYTQFQMSSSISWGYMIESMEAPTAVFDRAKRDYINGLLNSQVNPQWVQACNQQARQQSQQSAANHQANMAALRAQGDQIIAAGKAHDAATTRSHERFMDNLRDEVTITNPSTGTSYKVDMGSNHYWINDNNELITSDDATYNPNGDLNVTGANWVEAQIGN